MYKSLLHYKNMQQCTTQGGKKSPTKETICLVSHLSEQGDQEKE